MKKYKILDLFAGVGGLSYGFYHNENFEITDWKEYDIRYYTPDIIFTCAPYDSSNLVTMVHPDFHCERLSKLTDLLCYVPYFVHSYGDHVTHFPFLKGVHYSNLVFVQSQSIQKQYIEAIHNKKGISRELLENKIIGLGSPKLDKIINSSLENCSIPNDWKEKIENKQIIFYNTTLGMFLHNPENFLKKLRNVFEFFKTCESSVLIWRPHPFLEQTVLSMHPKLYTEWTRLYNFFIERNCGILDNTSDFSIGMIISDAYYGDQASFTELYQATNKPVLIQDLNSQLFADTEYSDIDLKSPVYFEYENKIRLADFITRLNEISAYNSYRGQQIRVRYANSDGTAGKKILEYAVAELNKK